MPDRPLIPRAQDPVDAVATPTSQPDHWSEMASRWQAVGAPLRPTQEDLTLYARARDTWTPTQGPPRVLLLGVTPELWHLPWPAGTDFLAVDRSRAMIHAVWPGPPEAVLCADWTTMALPPSSRDIALCDGGMILLGFPGAHLRLAGILRDTLAEGGVCILRLFAPPRRPESVHTVLLDLVEGRIPNVNILKLRLAMALQPSPAVGVELGAVWEAFRTAGETCGHTAPPFAFSGEPLRALEAYRDSTTRYCFVGVEEIAEVFCGRRGGFRVETVLTPSYELGDRCPVVVLRREGEGTG